jgi:hypothetical protein
MGSMLRRTVTTLATIGLLSLSLPAPPARAGDPLPGRMPGVQLPPRLQKPQGKIRVGSWVEFSIQDITKRRRFRLHWALVGKTGHSYWWELTFRQARKPVMRIKTLIKGTVTKPSRIKRVIVQSGTSQPLELPMKSGQKLMNVYLRKRSGAKTKDHGVVTLKVAAGTFQARHYSWKDTSGQTVHEWTSRKAGIWGLVRFRSSRFRMELIGQGRGARSRIRGIPAKWHLPGR